jgi:hypothetical protein
MFIIMNFNLKDITEISNLEDLNKYDIKKPIFLGSYLFEYLIMDNKLDILKLKKFPLNQYNTYGLNGFHLAARFHKYKILNYFIKTYPDYIYNFSEKKSYFIMFITEYDNKFISFLKDNQKINLSKLLANYNINKISTLDMIFLQAKINVIMYILDNIDINFKDSLLRPSFFYLLYNKNLNTKNKFKVFDKINKLKKGNLDLIDSDGKNILFYLKDLEFFEYFYEKNVDFDYLSPFDTEHILTNCYKNELYDCVKFIWDIIKDNHNFKETDKYGNNLATVIIIMMQEIKKKDYSLEKNILKHNDYWDLLNLDKKTAIDYLIQLDYNKFSDIIKNKKFNIVNDKIFDEMNENWYELLKDYPVKNCKIKDKCFDIIVKDYKFVNGNLFLSKFNDVCILFIKLNQKYKNLYLPKKEKKLKNYEIDTKGYENTLPLYISNNFDAFPWILLYSSNTVYSIHSELNNLMVKALKNKKYRFGFAFVSILIPNVILHANILIFDFKNNTMERFEPFGNLYKINEDLDKVLEEKFKDFTYIKPNDYLPTSGFQTLSDENIDVNQKPGDIGGFCLAWCFWYLEHRILNKDVEPKKLVEKMIKKIKYSDLSFVNYIRNYANTINNLRYNYLKKLGIKKDILSNISFNHDIENKINKSILDYHIKNN